MDLWPDVAKEEGSGNRLAASYVIPARLRNRQPRESTEDTHDSNRPEAISSQSLHPLHAWLWLRHPWKSPSTAASLCTSPAQPRPTAGGHGTCAGAARTLGRASPPGGPRARRLGSRAPASRTTVLRMGWPSSRTRARVRQLDGRPSRRRPRRVCQNPPRLAFLERSDGAPSASHRGLHGLVPTTPACRRGPDESPARTRVGWPQPLSNVTSAPRWRPRRPLRPLRLRKNHSIAIESRRSP